ncbi:MAG: hypothetical protein ACOH2H_15275 [Cypionkella sp.]
MKKRPVEVSDHAILRYLERVGGFNIDALRKAIAKRVQTSAPEGACSIVIDGFRFVIREDTQARVITTILRRDWEGPAHPKEDH